MVGNIEQIIQYLSKQDKTKQYEVKEVKDNRSLQQNKMLWELIHKIAKVQHQDDIEIYCALLERADAKSEYLMIEKRDRTDEEIEKTLRENFRGIKFIRKQIVNEKECNIYKAYIGSSKMTTKEMKELLDITIQLCSELRIPTMEV